MSLVLRSQAGQNIAIYSPAPQHSPVVQEDQKQDDELRTCTAAAIEAFSKGLLDPRYINQHGLVQTITSAKEIGPLMRKGLVLGRNGETLYLSRKGLLGGGPIDELEKKLQNKAPNKRSVFISYQWGQKDLAKDIHEEFEKRGYLVIRDESNLSHGVYLPGFMRILNHPNLDYVLVVVSDSYLKSKNCMYEVNQMMKRYNFSDTLLPYVVTEDQNTKADIYNGVQKYLAHWNEKLVEAKSTDDMDNLKIVENIIENCKTFADTVRTKINVPEADLKKQRYQPFFDMMLAREKDKEGDISKDIDALIIKSVRLEKIKDLQGADECHTSALKKIKDILHLDGLDPLCARLYGAYSEFLKRQNKAKEAEENLEIAKSFGYQEGSGSLSHAASSVAAAQSPTPAASSSSHPVSSVSAAEKASLLAAVEQTPSKFLEVSKILKTDDDLKALVNAFAFGKDKWQKHFGKINEAIPALPNNIVEILCSDDPFNKDKKMAETRMLVLVPRTVNGKPLNLKSFRELVKAPREGHKTDYEYIWDKLEEAHGATQPARAQWVLMTKDVIPGSRGLSYEEQKEMVELMPQHEVPDLLSATVGILTHYVRTGERLFSDKPCTLTRCKETAGGNQTIVGGFASAGLFIISSYDYFIHGVAALRKFL